MSSWRAGTADLPPVVPAAGWMMATLVSFSAMAVAARELSHFMSTFEILFFRSAVGLAILLAILGSGRGRVLRTGRPVLQLARNVAHFAAGYCWVLALSLIPLADVIAFEFTAPAWVTLLAALFLGERFTGARALAVAGGIAGVVVVVRPGIAEFEPAVLIAAAAAVGYGVSITMVKALTASDSPMTIVAYMTIIQLPMGLVLALPEWTAPTLASVPWILVVGGTALGAHYSMAKALRLADASVVLPFDFLRLPLIAAVGIWLYDEPWDVWVLVGSALIFGSSYQLAWRESRRAPAP